MSYIDIKIICAFFATIKYSYDTQSPNSILLT